ncbi:MAG: threonine synthase [Christensenellaceae bacterium]|nr:threonine synthase [Christensenellaceae bacterium]
MKVISTRDKSAGIGALSAVLKGISDDGGLFVPSSFPILDIDEMIGCSGYPELAAKVLSKFIDMDEPELKALTEEAYSSFDDPAVAPLKDLGTAQVLELWHGPTLAFKDMALQVLPRLMSKALDRQNEIKNIMILTATSGDTGKAALEGFCDVPRTAIVVYYPNSGVARLQQLQMETQEGMNTCVSSVDGNFDDAQTGVKELFACPEFREKMLGYGYSLSSANSINFGRLVPQVAYYVHAYADLVKRGLIEKGESINICVPTGNFGNILAAYYAGIMGIPVKTLICASNKNKILTDFFNTGVYDVNREFYKTMSPSMDILISSNLERLLFEMLGRDDEALRGIMADLKQTGRFEMPKEAIDGLKISFYADYATEEDTAASIKEEFDENGYLMDPHTAVAMHVYRKYAEKTGDDTYTVVASTANPYKFTQDVLKAVSGEDAPEAFGAAERLSEYTGTKVPSQILALKTKPVLHNRFARKGELGDIALKFAGGLNGRG